MRRMLVRLGFAASLLACGRIAAHSESGIVVTQSIVRGDAGRRIDRYLDAAQAFGFSGAVLVADRDGIVLRKGYGPADVTRRVAPSMIFDMGSMAKQFTAAAILLLESEGKLATTDTLSRFFADAPADKAGITLHQMMTHTSGLISDLADDYDQISRDSAVRVVLNSPLVAPPGKQFSYSNAAFSMLAVIVEQVTGRPYESFIRERIYLPAGMRHTGYRIPNLDSSLVARSYTPPVDHGTPAQRLARAGGPGWNLMGNGGVLTSVDDIYGYEQALRRGRPISAKIQAKQFAEQFRRSPSLAHGYDWGIEPAEDGGIFFSRAGDGPATGISADYRRYPRDSSVFVLLANNRHHGASTRRFVMPNLRRLYVGAVTIEPPIVRGAAPSELAQLEGYYRVDSASYFQLQRYGDHLAVSAVGQRAVDVTVFNRDSNSIRNRERVNQRAVNLVKALATQDSDATRAIFGAEANVLLLLRHWREAEARFGPFACVEILGTDRLDRGVFLSTVQLRFRDTTRTVRWAWSGARAVINSEDWYLSRTFGFGADSPVDAGAWSPYWWLSGRGSVVTYDLLTNQTLVARVVRGAGGNVEQLVFALPQREISAMRVEAARRPHTPAAYCSN
jgi:CubicO group peptidase (beta-lactamase class C family)